MLNILLAVTKAVRFFYGDEHTYPVGISWPNQLVQSLAYNAEEKFQEKLSKFRHGSKDLPLRIQQFVIPLASSKKGAGGGGTERDPLPRESAFVNVGKSRYETLVGLPVALYIPLDWSPESRWQLFSKPFGKKTSR